MSCDPTTTERSRGRTDIVISVTGLEAREAYRVDLDGYNGGPRYVYPIRTHDPSFLYKNAWPGRYVVRVSNKRDRKVVAERALEIRAPEPNIVAPQSVAVGAAFRVAIANAVGPKQNSRLYLTVVPEHYPLANRGQTKNNIKPACDVLEHEFRGLPAGKYEMRLFQSSAREDPLLAKKTLLVSELKNTIQGENAGREQLLRQLEQAKQQLEQLESRLGQQQPARGVVTTVVGPSTYGECVDYARYYVPSLPRGLFTYDDKKRIANVFAPAVGSVAVIEVKTGHFVKEGHVAVVESFTNNTITIKESNWNTGLITRRTASGVDLKDAESQLNIYGYFQPDAAP